MWIPGVLGVFSALGLLSWYTLTGTPVYSVYRFTHAIQSRDADAAVEYVDMDRVAGAATEVLVADSFGRRRHSSNVFEAMGQGLALQTMKPQVAARVEAEIRRLAETGGGAGAVPVGLFAVFGGVGIRRDGDQAWVTYTDPRHGPTGFKMSRQADRSWKVTEFDPDWIRRQMRQHPPR
jgi:hypothetical protein